MKIGIIGLGSIGARHTRNLQELFPTATIDILTKRKTFEDAGPRTQLLSSAEEFYSLEHDVFFITNETDKHAETILKCLAQSPKGIFVEKPLTHELRNLDKIVREVKKQKCIFAVGYCMQFFKPYQEIKKLLHKRAIGEVQSMRIVVGQDLRSWRKGRPNTDYRSTYSAGRNGGVVFDLIHELNIGGWLLEEPLAFVSGSSARISDLKIKAEDIAEAVLRGKKSVVSVHLDYLQVPGVRSVDAYGTKGSLHWRWILNQPDSTHTIEVYTAKASTRHLVKEIRGEMYKREVKDFFKHVQKGDHYTNIDEAVLDMHNAVKLRNAKI